MDELLKVYVEGKLEMFPEENIGQTQMEPYVLPMGKLRDRLQKTDLPMENTPQ